MRLFCICLLVTCILLTSCKNKVNTVKEEVNSIAVELDESFKSFEDLVTEAADKIEDVYKNKDQYTTPIEQLDIENGGYFSIFGQGSGQKYYTKKPYLNTLMTVLDVEVDDSVREKAAIFPYIVENITHPLMENNENVDGVFFGQYYPYNHYVIEPWYDVVSVLDVGLPTFDNNAWFTMSHENQGNPTWTPDAFVTMSATTGWLIICTRSITIHGQEQLGTLTAEVWIEKVLQKYFLNNQSNLILLSPSLTILGTTKSAKSLIPFKDLGDFDFLEQLKNNAFIADEYKLVDKTQPADLQALGKKIQEGADEFEISINGKEYVFIVKNIDTVGFKIAGFVEK